ncbi:peptidase family S66 [Apiospora rasikravindrae]|uniref:Peptidase family S66 n=1 Tax=Apiospora rasikravindrae TaxID=990691 RepID=A0ABR1SVU6_9PEZI
MSQAIIPRALQPGAKIALISPSARLNHELPAALARGVQLISSQGYEVVEIYHGPDSGIQSSIANRLAELRAAFSDPSVAVVWATIGGSTFTELLPALLADTELHDTIRANPKIVVGYSDITGLHWFLYSLGLRTFYGPGIFPELAEPRAADHDKYEASALGFCVKHVFRAMTDPTPIGAIARSPTYAPDPARVFTDPDSTEPPRLVANPGWTWLRGGQAQGRLFGGCLTVMARLGGVRAIAPDWKGRIVFLETALADDNQTGNPIYRVQAGVADLIAQGVFEEAAGLVVGRPFGYDSAEMRESYMRVIREHFCEGRLAPNGFPILFGVDFGHTTPMVTLPYDALAVLDSAKDEFAVIESVVRT